MPHKSSWLSFASVVVVVVAGAAVAVVRGAAVVVVNLAMGRQVHSFSTSFFTFCLIKCFNFNFSRNLPNPLRCLPPSLFAFASHSSS